MKSIFEKSREGRRGYSLPPCDVSEKELRELLPPGALREELSLPELSEVDVVRHFTRLSQGNLGVDTAFYPLGSCTMKYNPKRNELVASWPGFIALHPYQPVETVQGALRLLYELERQLCEITGMERFTLQPSAGAHGELTGMMIIKEYFRQQGEMRKKVLVPDSAHGTNPASAAMCGFEVMEIKSNPRGGVDLQALKDALGEDVAAFMLTIPNTSGLFEEEIEAIAQSVHQAGAFLYCDGANLNALLGLCRIAELGFDLIHLNLHKTFSTPHGGGGPGAGPLGVVGSLAPFLPVPQVERRDERYFLNYERPSSIGRVKDFYGNFLVMVRAYAYILSLGAKGMREVGENALLNANYMHSRLKEHYPTPFPRRCMHEFIITPTEAQKEAKITTLDIAKRLLDHGFHAPTIYFPLTVEQAIMIEPTETESKESMDEFIGTMIEIAKESQSNPQTLKDAPCDLPVGRVDVMTANSWRQFNWFKKVVNLPPLLPWHVQNHAQMFLFAQWYMPLFYTSVEEEHHRVRQACGLFDVSHMGRIEVRGKEALFWLEGVTSNCVSKMEVNQAQYSLLLNERGGIVDDIYLYKLGQERFLIVVNAINRIKDLEWLKGHCPHNRVEISDVSREWAQMALQGPMAHKILEGMERSFDLPLAKNLLCQGSLEASQVVVSRTGYTGEDGFEIYLPTFDGERLWKALLQRGDAFDLLPCGLGARNTLRLEAGNRLYGNELEEDITPLEAGLAWVLCWEKDFLGKDALLKQRSEGPERLLAGFEMVDREAALPCAKTPIVVDGGEAGQVTSSALSPTLDKGIGMAFILAKHAHMGSEISFQSPKGALKGKIVQLPFVKRALERKKHEEITTGKIP